MFLLQTALQEEIQYLQRAKLRSTYTLHDGFLITSTLEDDAQGNTISAGYYRFENQQLLNLAPDAGATFSMLGNKFHGVIQFCDRYEIEVTIEGCIAPHIDSVTVEIESWKLLEIQRDRLAKIKLNKMVDLLQSENISPSPESLEFVFGQLAAVEHVKNNPITIIWGPPGTGKTYTLAQIALMEMKEKRRVLILSQSNMAVDSAILQLGKALDKLESTESTKNKVLRYGMVKSPELLIKKKLLSYDVAFENNPDLKEKYLKLSLEIKEEGKTPKELQDLIDERREVQQKIGNYEIALIQNASVVAVTATKATISKAIYEQEWDTVIFDEISMAYISQVMIAASMAKKKLVLIGDFKQLAPIVQNDNPKSLLRKDIFSYLNVVKDGTVRKHQWLVMLNVQWRMHPAIAEFANKHIYLGRLKTAEKSINTRDCSKSSIPEQSICLYRLLSVSRDMLQLSYRF